MAFWDFIKELRLNQEEERKRREQGGAKNRIFGFLDDTLDLGGDVGKKVVGTAAGLAREATVKPITGFIASAEEKQQDYTKQHQLELIQKLKDLKPAEREDYIKNHPVLSNRMKDGKLEFKDTTNPWLFGNPKNADKVMAEIDVKDNTQLEKLAAQIEERDKANDTGRQSTNFVDRQIFGNEPIQAYQNRGAGLEKEGWSPAMAVAGTTANAVLDSPITLGTGSAIKSIGKAGLKQLAEAGTKEAVESLLKGKLSDEVVKKLSPLIAQTTDAKAIKDLIKSADTNVVKRIATGKTKQDVVDEAVSGFKLPNSTDPLANGSVRNQADTVVEDVNKQKLTEDYGTQPPIKPPIDTTPMGGVDPDAKKAYEEMGGRIKSTDQIDAMKKEKSFAQRTYEGYFDENAPLDIFNRINKERTGKDLLASMDPAKIRQQRYGIEEQMKAYIQPTADALSSLNKDTLDAVVRLGEARQILDRSDKYAPEIVDRMNGVVRYVDQAFNPEQRKAIEDGITAVQTHSDNMLRMLVDSGDMTEEAYTAIKSVNPNFFAKRNLVEYMLDNPSMFSVKSSNVARENIIKAVKGIEDDSRYVIQDPLESLVTTTEKILDRVSKSSQFDAAKKLQEVMPDVVVPLRNAEDVLARFDLAFDSREMRKVRNKLVGFAKSQSRLIRKLESEINSLNKQGMNASLKSTKTPMPDFTPSGLGGKVPTSKAGGVNPSKTGPRDTAAFVRSLVEGDSKQLAAIRKKIANRDPKLSGLIDELYSIKSEYDDVVTKIKSNSEEMAKLQDADVPEGFKAVSRQKNGVTERIALPAEVADAWAGMDAAQRDMVGKFSRYFSKPIRASVTTLSLPFQLVKNPIRDARQTMFTSRYIPIGNYITVLPYAQKWARGFWDAARDTDFAQQIRLAGGGGAGVYNDYRNAQNVAKNIRRSVSGPEIHNPKDLMREATRILGTLYGKAEGVGRALEYAPRLAEARAAYKKTGDITEAASAARNVTVDFSKFGKEGRVLNDYLLFLNTRLQGNKNVISSIKRNPKRAAVAATANIAMPLVGLYLWNKGQHGDVYDQISQDTKDNNFILILGDEQDSEGNFTQVLKIPKNEPDKFFGNIAQAVIDGIANEKTDQSLVNKAVKTGASVLPIDVQKGGEFNLSRTIGSLLPQPIKPLAEVAANKNFYYDSPIVPDSMKNLPNDMQRKTDAEGNDKTPAVADFVASLTGMSPLKAQHLTQATTGQITTGNPAKQLGGALVGSDSRQVENQFYKLKKDADRNRASASEYINRSIAAGNYQEAQATADAYNQYVKELYGPFGEKYGKFMTEDLITTYDKLKINLTKSSIKARRKSALANSAQ